MSLRAAFYLTLAIASLSCVLFIADQVSTDIARWVKENDTAALALHNQLHAHGAAIDEAVRKKDADNLLTLQNSQPAPQNQGRIAGIRDQQPTAFRGCIAHRVA